MVATANDGAADMIELEFEGALQAASGIAEAFDAAGIDDHVPTRSERVGT
jgi:hypothetical protein